MRPPAAEEGWERRFVADLQRAEEAIALYTSAGFEVRAEPAQPADFDSGCESCWLVQSGLFRVIFTRRRGGSDA
jgi:hypothetical protein